MAVIFLLIRNFPACNTTLAHKAICKTNVKTLYETTRKYIKQTHLEVDI